MRRVRTRLVSEGGDRDIVRLYTLTHTHTHTYLCESDRAYRAVEASKLSLSLSLSLCMYVCMYV